MKSKKLSSRGIFFRQVSRNFYRKQKYEYIWVFQHRRRREIFGPLKYYIFCILSRSEGVALAGFRTEGAGAFAGFLRKQV